MFPKWDQLNGSRMACIVHWIEGKTLALLVFDRDVSETDWVYAFAINETGVSQLQQVIDARGGYMSTFPGSCWADALAYMSTGELPGYAGKEIDGGGIVGE